MQEILKLKEEFSSKFLGKKGIVAVGIYSRKDSYLLYVGFVTPTAREKFYKKKGNVYKGTELFMTVLGPIAVWDGKDDEELSTN